MKRYRNSEVIAEIQNGNKEILFYLSRKYFQSSRRLLRRKGLPDDRTPEVFSAVLVRVYRDLKQSKLSSEIDFEAYLFRAMEDFVKEDKAARRENKVRLSVTYSDQQRDVVSQCVSILDDQAEDLLIARYAEKLSYEEIASRFELTNPVVAQEHVSKAMELLEGIVKARLNLSSHS